VGEVPTRLMILIVLTNWRGSPSSSTTTSLCVRRGQIVECGRARADAGDRTLLAPGSPGYFLRLGTLGFGGPIALCGYMQRDLVERRRWIAPRTTSRGSPSRSSRPARWPRSSRSTSAGCVPACSARRSCSRLRSPLVPDVLVLSALYVRYGGLAWMQGRLYGHRCGGPSRSSRGARGSS